MKRSLFFRASVPVVAAISGLASVAFADKTDPSEFKPSTVASSSASAPAASASGIAMETPVSSAAPTPSATPAPKPSTAPLTVPSSASARPAPKEEDPLVIPEGIRGVIGAAPAEAAAAPVGSSEISGAYPFAYSERRTHPWGSEHTSVAFPFYYGHTERDPVGALTSSSRLYGPLYYR
ncbi:MAG: hypothetical protein ACHREM_22825, partial [Polyangiales bacterium]